MSKKEQAPPIHHPDDHLFGKVLRETANAKAYIQRFYPEIAEQVDLDTLTLESDSFLTEQFDFYKADILYRCKWKNSKGSLYFSLLWEHKRQAETYVAIQMGLYIFLAMHKITMEKGRPLEPILPLLFYNGQRAWKPKTIHALFEKKSYFEFFKPYLPNFQFLFTNISQVPTKDILEIEEAFFRSALLAMANRHNADLIFKHINLIFDLEDSHYLNVMVTYIIAVMNRPPAEIRTLFQQLKGNKKEKVMSTLDMIMQEGFVKGKKEGKEEGKREAKKEAAMNSLVMLLKIFNKFPTWTVKEIAQFTDINEEVVKAMKLVLTSKDKKQIWTVIDKQFLLDVKLSKAERAKLNKLVGLVVKKKN